MAFSLSPAVTFREIDLSTTIPSVASSIGATVGQYHWGPVHEIRTIISEDSLKRVFGKPTNYNFQDWFSAKNFLDYSNNLKTVRTVVEPELDSGSFVSPSGSEAAYNAADFVSPSENAFVKNQEHFDEIKSALEENGHSIIAKYPGSNGNNIDVSMRDGDTWDNSPEWKYAEEFDKAPDSDQFAVVVRYEGQIQERFIVSTDPEAKDYTGKSIYAETLINRESAYIWVLAENLIVSGQTIDFEDQSLVSGADGDAIGQAEYDAAWELFSNPEDVDINLAFVGGAPTMSAKNVIQNIAENRLDCVAFISPQMSSVVGSKTPAADIVEDRNEYPSSSYAFMDGNYKYQYDRYNDVNRWVPLNGDMAGLSAQTDSVAEAWFSPAGYNRGFVKNVVKLAFNPGKAYRDMLYKNEVNPVINEQGMGTVLLGDKTMQATASAFDRINVRRLFIVLEKAISTYAKQQLFEFNDPTTRRQFLNAVIPYLRNIQSRRGIDEFKVVADKSNNTDQVIQSNQFIGDIYIKPRYSINFIRLNFVSVSPSISFEEIVDS